MSMYSEECLKTFLRDQEKLFDEPVAETLEEAEAFLEDCMAVIVDSIDEVREYFEEEGVDVDGMTPDELEEGRKISDCRRIVKSRRLFHCGFFNGFFYGVQYDLGRVRRILREGHVIQRLGLIDLIRNVFDSGLDERKHGCDGFIQIGKTD